MTITELQARLTAEGADARLDRVATGDVAFVPAGPLTLAVFDVEGNRRAIALWFADRDGYTHYAGRPGAVHLSRDDTDRAVEVIRRVRTADGDHVAVFEAVPEFEAMRPFTRLVDEFR